ncbi:unnamed protein product [Protopolystoma xenopodis]|uniref:Uncharacterized protein n=1 Tax=Protopolystoma xenopodis TaxID=117903 RepID=A0A3S5FC09_9PLAT|nr:unnamed protein product [Protopolystoma xenopodis]
MKSSATSLGIHYGQTGESNSASLIGPISPGDGGQLNDYFAPAPIAVCLSCGAVCSSCDGQMSASPTSNRLTNSLSTSYRPDKLVTTSLGNQANGFRGLCASDRIHAATLDTATGTEGIVVTDENGASLMRESLTVSSLNSLLGSETSPGGKIVDILFAIVFNFYCS